MPRPFPTLSSPTLRPLRRNSRRLSPPWRVGGSTHPPFPISDGAVYAFSSSCEGIESKGELTISGGVVEVEASDDAINSASTLTISGGLVYAHSTSNDGIDSNGDLRISDGTIVAYGSADPECGIDANDEENYHLYITGGTVFSIGGSNLSYPYSTTGSQPYVTLSASASNLALKSSDGSLVCAWDYSQYSTLQTTASVALTASVVSSPSSSRTNKAGFGGPGGQGGPGGSSSSSLKLLFSSPSLVSGSSYTLYSGVTISSPTSLFHGLTTSAAVSSGSQLSSATAATSTSSDRW